MVGGPKDTKEERRLNGEESKDKKKREGISHQFIGQTFLSHTGITNSTRSR